MVAAANMATFIGACKPMPSPGLRRLEGTPDAVHSPANGKGHFEARNSRVRNSVASKLAVAPFTLVVNGKRRKPDVQPGKRLLWVPRDALGLKGTKFGCGMGLLGHAPWIGRRGGAVLPNAR